MNYTNNEFHIAWVFAWANQDRAFHRLKQGGSGKDACVQRSRGELTATGSEARTLSSQSKAPVVSAAPKHQSPKYLQMSNDVFAFKFLLLLYSYSAHNFAAKVLYFSFFFFLVCVSRMRLHVFM